MIEQLHLFAILQNLIFVADILNYIMTHAK